MLPFAPFVAPPPSGPAACWVAGQRAINGRLTWAVWMAGFASVSILCTDEAEARGRAATMNARAYQSALGASTRAQIEQSHSGGPYE